jgi:hypothetical protein
MYSGLGNECTRKHGALQSELSRTEKPYLRVVLGRSSDTRLRVVQLHPCFHSLPNRGGCSRNRRCGPHGPGCPSSPSPAPVWPNPFAAPAVPASPPVLPPAAPAGRHFAAQTTLSGTSHILRSSPLSTGPWRLSRRCSERPDQNIGLLSIQAVCTVKRSADRFGGDRHWCTAPLLRPGQLQTVPGVIVRSRAPQNSHASEALSSSIGRGPGNWPRSLLAGDSLFGARLANWNDGSLNTLLSAAMTAACGSARQ